MDLESRLKLPSVPPVPQAGAEGGVGEREVVDDGALARPTDSPPAHPMGFSSAYVVLRIRADARSVPIVVWALA